MEIIKFKDNELDLAEKKRNELVEKGYRAILCYKCGIITGIIKDIHIKYEEKK